MPPLPTMFDSCSGRGSMTNGSIGSFGGSNRQVAAEVRIVRTIGRLKLAGRRNLVRCVAGHHLVDGGGVIEQTSRRVADAVDQGGAVEHLGEVWHHFADVVAGDPGLQRLEIAADVVGCIGLGIPDVEMARAALEEDEDHRLRLAPTGPAPLAVRGRHGRLAKHPGQGQTEQTAAADLQPFAPRQAAVTEPAATGAGIVNIWKPPFGLVSRLVVFYRLNRNAEVVSSTDIKS